MNLSISLKIGIATCLLLPSLALASAKSSNCPEEKTMPDKLRIATFNVSMEASNYPVNGKAVYDPKRLTEVLMEAKHKQVHHIAEIIQRVRPDILLLNEFDFIAEPRQGIRLFEEQYLKRSQNNQEPISYPFIHIAPVNTGIKTGLNDKHSRLTHFGFGRYPGQYGMALLSKYPIDVEQIRSFQKFLWQDMPGNLMPKDENDQPWYKPEERDIMRLSSKSHWDIPIKLNCESIHILASHPTPPVFDGPEDRNGRRNHDEIRFWKDYVQGDSTSYHYDDKALKGGIRSDNNFVILGDLNANTDEGDAYPGTMEQLLDHPRINHYPAPASTAGRLNKPESKVSTTHTAAWGMRADYVLPSAKLQVLNSGVFWPEPNSKEFYLVKDRYASSDHRLVWVDIKSPSAKID